MLSVPRKALKQIAGPLRGTVGVRSRLRNLVRGGIGNVGLPAIVVEAKGLRA